MTNQEEIKKQGRFFSKEKQVWQSYCKCGKLKYFKSRRCWDCYAKGKRNTVTRAVRRHIEK